MKKILIWVFLLWLPTYMKAQQDSIKLPFAISDEKKLDEDDLAHKKTGWSIAGVPQLSSDPVNGFGYGAEGNLFFNGKKTDSFFNYTPYRLKIFLEAFNTTRSQNELVLGVDIPYIFNSKWRVRVEGVYENDPNMIYFGVTEKSLQHLSNPQNGGSYTNYDDYARSLTGSYKNYNRYIEKNNRILNLSAERSFFHSKMRAVFGFRYSNYGIFTYPGNSYLVNEFNAGNLQGLGRNNINFLQAGLVYDTRNLDSDPDKGIFAEVTNSVSLRTLGSQYTFNKFLFHIKGYQKLLPNRFKAVVLAMRGALAAVNGATAFYEYQEAWSTEGELYDLLGGRFGLRGYKQARFLANYVAFANIELRSRFAQFTLFKQHVALSAVPFFDIGGVGNTPSRLFGYSANYRYDGGLGLRIAWNVNTILRFDYALSKEDRQFFFQFGHAF